MIAAKNTNPPNAPNATMAPKFNFALPLLFESSLSTLNGTLTLGDWSDLILTFPAISLSCGWAAAITFIGFLLTEIGVLLGIVSNGRTRVDDGLVSALGGELLACPFLGIITVGRNVRFGGISSRTVPGNTISTSSGLTINKTKKIYN